MEISEFLETQVYPYLNRGDVFADLAPVDKGESYACKCPACGERRAFIYKTGYVLACNRRDNCANRTSMLEHMAGVKNPRGDQYVNAAKRLAELAGTKLPEPTEEQVERAAKQVQRASFMERVYEICRNNQSLETILYYQGRGFTDPEFGTFTWEALRELPGIVGLFGKDESDPTAGEKLAFAWEGRAVLPVYDRYGRLVSFIGAGGPVSKDPKYLYMSRLRFDQLGAFGLDAFSGDSLILCEGYIDVLLGRQFGISEMAAIGGTTVNAERIALLQKWGVKTITLFPDNDKGAGHEGVLSTIKAVDSLANPPRVFVCDTTLYRGHKDPDEILRHEGVDCFKNIVDSAMHYDTYRARGMSVGLDLSKPKAKTAFLDACWEVHDKCKSEARRFELREFFLPEVLRLIPSMDTDSLASYLDERTRAQDKERQTQELRTLGIQAQKILDEQGYEAALDGISAKALRLQEQRIDKPVKQIPESMWDEIDYYIKEIEKWNGKDFVGIPQYRLPTLDTYTLGIRGLTFLAAQPNIGKTLLAAQIAGDAVLEDPTVCCVFVSLEMGRGELGRRMFANYQKKNWKDLPANTDLIGLAKEQRPLYERMLMLDRELLPFPTADSIAKQALKMKMKSGCTKCLIVIDYFQVFPVPGEEMMTELVKDNIVVEQLKLLRAMVNNDPVMVISEARKPDQSTKTWAGGLASLRGSARLAYVADVVLLLNPLSDEQLLKFVRLNDQGPYAANPEVCRAYNDYDEDLKPKEMAKKAEAIRRVLAESGKDFVELRVDKVRDGGRKGNIILTNNYTQCRFWEGFDEQSGTSRKAHGESREGAVVRGVVQEEDPLFSEDDYRLLE